MFPKLSMIIITLLTISARLVKATPPACLLAAVNTQPNPADLNTICGVDASKVISQIKSLCGSNIDAAMTSFADTCNSAGKAIATSLPTSATISATPSTSDSTHVSTTTTSPESPITTTLTSSTTPPPNHPAGFLPIGTGYLLPPGFGGTSNGTAVMTATLSAGPSSALGMGTTTSPTYAGAAGRIGSSFAGLIVAMTGLVALLV